MKLRNMKQHLLAVAVTSILVIGPTLSFADRDRDQGRSKHENHEQERHGKKPQSKNWVVVKSKRGKGKPSAFYQSASRWAKLDKEAKHRQKTKNNWRNAAIASGALALYGALKHDNTLTFVGAAGALYSLDRYEHDRKSQSKTQRMRASYFSKPYIVRNGVKYKRHIVTRNGKKYFQFVRV